MEREDSGVTELISDDGELNEAGLDDFINLVRLHECGISYSVVGIMGPHNSGKSTLLNHLFGTRFEQRNASSEWGVAVTRGVWIAKAREEPFTLVMDLEGTDGKERGQDDTSFEKRSALFALAVADILLINMWSRDFGREHAANRPLLRTIFEAVFTMPSFNRRKTTLFYVMRDVSPFDPPLETPVRNDIQKIWNEAQKPEGREDTPLSEFFNVEFFALSNYQEKREEFVRQVDQVRQQILNSVSGDRPWAVAAAGFCLSTKEIWATIKQNKYLDLPAHKVMVSTTLCDEIAKKKLGLFKTNEERLGVEAAAEIRVVSGFGAKISSILSRYLSDYDSESLNFDENVRNEKRQYLESEALRLVHPAYIKTLGHLRSEQFQSFKTGLEELLREGGGFAESARNWQQSCVLEFNRGCLDAAVEQAGWECDASTVRDQLLLDIENHTLLVRAEKFPQVVDQCRERLSRNLADQLRQIFTSHEEEITWGAVRRALRRECDAAASDLSWAVDGFELDQTTVEQKVNDLKQYARQLVENKFREEARGVLGLMNQRYVLSLQAVTSADEARRTAAHEAACRRCLKILSIMAVIRLDEGDDNVESVLLSALLGADAGVQVSQNPLDATTWEQIRPEVTLITPVQCKVIWEQFKLYMERILPRVNRIEEIGRAANRWLPPTWVTVGLLALGFTGFMLFLRVTNLDVVLAVISAAGRGIQLLGAGAAIYTSTRALINLQDIDFDRFRRTHTSLMRNLRRSLQEMNELMTLPSRGSVVEVAA